NRLLEIAYFAEDGRPIVGPQGYHRATYRYDARGSQTESWTFGLKGEPAVPSWGYHRWVTRYDAKGHKPEQAHFGPHGEPAFRADDGSFRYVNDYDSRGNLVRVRILGPNGRPMNVKDGWARRQDEFDAAGKREQSQFWKADPHG